MSAIRKQTITVHISPYVGGLAPVTYDYIRRLNEEAKRLRTGVSFIALANRILAHGFIGRALRFANTLGAWQLRRALADGYLAHQPVPRWETPAIEGEQIVLRRGNSQHRAALRKLEKNRSRRRLEKELLLSPEEVVRLKIKVAAGTLYHLVDAIPEWERDSHGIYPGERIILPLRKQRLPGLGLRVYSERTKLLFKNGRYEFVTRQKAASPVLRILITPEIAAFYVWLLERPPSPETQHLLKGWGRLYKANCYWSEKGQRRLFDKGRTLSAPPQP